MSVEQELQQLSYRELQQRARAVGLKANGKAIEIVERLIEHERKQFLHSPAQLTSRTTRTAGEGRPTRLSVAAATPLPAQRPTDQGPRVASTNKQPASRRQQRAPHASTSRSAFSSLVFKLLIAAAAVAAVAALAVPYCEQHDCRAQMGGVTEVLVAAATAADRQCHLHVHSWSSAVQLRWQIVRGRLLSSFQEAGNHSPLKPPACHFDAAAALKRIARGGELGMSEWAAAAALSSDGKEVQDKASVGLIVCAAASSCDAAVDAVVDSVAGIQSCVNRLHGQQLGEDKGLLQSKLAHHLRSMPSSIIVLHRVDQMAPALLPVLVNAFSEQGAFQDSGRAVPTAGATYILTALMPAKTFAHVADEVAFHQEVRRHLVNDFVMRAAGDTETVEMHAKALRRRIDATILANSSLSGPQPPL